MGADTVGMGYYFHQKPLFLQVFYHGFSGLIAVHTRVFAAQLIDGGIIVHDGDLRQTVAFSHFKVIGVMGRCDLHTSGTEFFIHIFVCHNRDLPVCQRQLQHFTNQVFVSVILGINCNSRISQKGLWTRGCDLYIASFLSDDRVIDVPEKSVLILMLYLRVRDRCLTYRTPVDNA